MIKAKQDMKFKFFKEEDAMIQNLVIKYGNKWVTIAKEMKTRTSRQIRERYLNYLDPNIQKKDWSDEEEDQLVYFLLMNPVISWKALSKHFPGRTDVYLKNRAAVSSFKNKISMLKQSSLKSNALLTHDDLSIKMSKANELEEILDEKFLDENVSYLTWLFNIDSPPKKEIQEN
jgi:hypothetical protein